MSKEVNGVVVRFPDASIRDKNANPGSERYPEEDEETLERAKEGGREPQQVDAADSHQHPI